MTRTRRAFLAATIGVALGSSFGALAATVPLPAEQHRGNVGYVSGGNGKDEAAAFERATAHYPLTLEFFGRTKDKDFPSDVTVTIRDGAGREVLNTHAGGPFLLVKLPAGEYKVSATYNGQPDERTVKVGSTNHHRLVFEWRA